jgi:hypothetical protein
VPAPDGPLTRAESGRGNISVCRRRFDGLQPTARNPLLPDLTKRLHPVLFAAVKPKHKSGDATFPGCMMTKRAHVHSRSPGCVNMNRMVRCLARFCGGTRMPQLDSASISASHRAVLVPNSWKPMRLTPSAPGLAAKYTPSSTTERFRPQDRIDDRFRFTASYRHREHGKPAALLYRRPGAKKLLSIEASNEKVTDRGAGGLARPRAASAAPVSPVRPWPRGAPPRCRDSGRSAVHSPEV